jgi:hypothetical protein
VINRLEGRFHRVQEWDAGGVQIFDMESEPVALRTSGFDSVHLWGDGVHLSYDKMVPPGPTSPGITPAG